MSQILIRPDELAVSEEGDVLMSLALGSSLAICMYDQERRIGGMVHTLLPWKRQEVSGEGDGLRYVDTSVQVLCDTMVSRGACRQNLRAKLAGGARIFSFSREEGRREVGTENILCARQKLQELGIPVVSEDTGENYGRSVYFHSDDGRLEIETVNRSNYWI